MSLDFWFVSVENLSVLFDAVYEGTRYPVSAYPGALRFVFVTPCAFSDWPCCPGRAGWSPSWTRR